MTTSTAMVQVVGICSQGWFSCTLTLGQFGRARANLSRMDIVWFSLVGALVDEGGART